MYVKIHIILFKNLKHVIKLVYQMRSGEKGKKTIKKQRIIW